MELEIGITELCKVVVRQLSGFFPLSNEDKGLIKSQLVNTLARCEYLFSNSMNKYYFRNGKTYFNPYHSGQYTIFLYYLSHSIYRLSSTNAVLSDKIYYLNKIMNSCDLFYEVNLPQIFFLDHPVGSVMGRATYGNYFTFSQNCTVGNNNGIFPNIGENVKMSANSLILGNCQIGNNVILGANTCIKDQDVPENSLIFGSSPNLIIKPRIKYP